MNRIDRRQFLTLVSAASLHPAPGSSAHARSRPVVQEFKVALPIAPILSPVRRDATADYYELEQRESSVEIIPGVRTRIWGYGGSFPGPTIEARQGRATVVTHMSNLNVPTVAHLHGGVTRPDSDGFPTDGWLRGSRAAIGTTTRGRLHHSGITIMAGATAGAICTWGWPASI